MIEQNSILFEKLEQQEKILTKQTEELSDIKQALIDIKVQGREITHMTGQIDALWKKYDAAFGPEGTIAKMQAHVSACPKDDLRAQIKLQWGAIALVVALIGALKIWG